MTDSPTEHTEGLLRTRLFNERHAASAMGDPAHRSGEYVTQITVPVAPSK